MGQFVLSEQSPWQALLGIEPEPAATAGGPQASGPTGPQSLPVTGKLRVGESTVDLEIASTPSEQENGLMFRTSLPSDRGMLFRLDRAQPVTMWMRNTLIPLDIIFIKDGKVTGVEANVPPCEDDPCPTYPSATAVDSIIELAAGKAAELGLEPGQPITIEGS